VVNEVRTIYFIILDYACVKEYNVGMNSIQYTIRSIPTKLDHALRQRSKVTGKSLNEIVIATLEKGAGITAHSEFDDLDWFIGGKSLDGSFDEDLNWLDNLPKEL
jgi:hypothetical protein